MGWFRTTTTATPPPPPLESATTTAQRQRDSFRARMNPRNARMNTIIAPTNAPMNTTNAPMGSATTIALPHALLLLVHLHILEYPHAHREEYDAGMFAARTRGLRERARTMEDVAFFLVGRVEGRGAKNIFPTYPCDQPSEQRAFRTSLAKYLEGLRHQSVFAKGATQAEAAWWWKDVVVRKSLLDECSGDKFERLMLALSTHALLKMAGARDPDMMSELLRTQPMAYATALKRYHTIRHAWSRSASLLMRAQADFGALRERLQEQSRASKYDAVPTERLTSLAGAAFHELIQRRWTGAAGKRALEFVVELAGLNLTSSRPLLPPSVSADHAADMSTTVAVTPSPLPIAAAHHPSHLKRLRRPVLQPKTDAEGSDAPPAPVRSHATIVIADYLDAEKRVYQTLTDALAKLQQRGTDLKAHIKALMGAHPSTPGADTQFWTLDNEIITPIDFAPQVDMELIVAAGFQSDFAKLGPDTANEEILEKRIEEIRREVLPPYPPVPDLSAPRLPHRDYKPKPAATKSSFLHSQAGGLRAPTSAANKEHATPSTLPVPPAMSPSKSARSIRRKSVRFSMASRRSMFRVFSGQVNDEVDRLVDETHDFPTDDEDTEHEHSMSFKTPKGEGKRPVNRIWTAGTPMSAKRNVGQPAQAPPITFNLMDGEPPMRLPSITLSTSTASLDQEEDEDARVSPSLDVDATPRPWRHGRQSRASIEAHTEDGEEPQFGDTMHEDDGELAVKAEGEVASDAFYEDAPSLTLKEILLATDTSHFDLLAMPSEDLEEGSLAEDASFVWG